MSIWKSTKKQCRVSRGWEREYIPPSEIITKNAKISEILSGWIGGSKTNEQTIPDDIESFKFDFRRENSHKAMVDYLQTNDLCPHCRQNKAKSSHHIIPRKYGGDLFSDNIIMLCNECHDYIEIKTEDFIKSGIHYDKDLLKSMILNKGF